MFSEHKIMGRSDSWI